MGEKSHSYSYEIEFYFEEERRIYLNLLALKSLTKNVTFLSPRTSVMIITINLLLGK